MKKITNSVARMVRKHHVKGWTEFETLVSSIEKEGLPINIFFKGDNNEQGESWCPYCNLAKPVVTAAVDKFAPEESHFITVEIDNPFWKDRENPFRKDPRTHLVFLPTLLRWKGAQRLDGSQAAKEELVEMLLED